MKPPLMFSKTLNNKLHKNISLHPVLYSCEIFFSALKGKQELQLCIFKNKIIFETIKNFVNHGMNKIIHYFVAY
jgi:hypothetical protein